MGGCAAPRAPSPCVMHVHIICMHDVCVYVYVCVYYACTTIVIGGPRRLWVDPVDQSIKQPINWSVYIRVPIHLSGCVCACLSVYTRQPAN